MPFDQIYWNGGGGFEDAGEYISSAAQRIVVGKTANSHPDSTFTAHPAVEDVGTPAAEPGTNIDNIPVYLAATGNRSGYTTNNQYQNFLANNTNDTFFMGIHDSNKISVQHAGIPYNGARLVMGIEFGYAAGRPTFTQSNDGEYRGEVINFKTISVYNNSVLQRASQSEHAGDRFINITNANSSLPANATVARNGNTLTFANVDIRTYLLINFRVNAAGQVLNITSVNGNTTATTDTAGGNFTAAAFNIDIPAGAPDVNTTVFSNNNHLNTLGHGFTDVGTRGQGNNFTWGGVCVKDALINGSVVADVYRNTAGNGTTEGNYQPVEHPLWSNQWQTIGGVNIPFPAVPDVNQNYRRMSATVDVLDGTFGDPDLWRASPKSAAAWPNYNNDIGAITAGTQAGQLPVNVNNQDEVQSADCVVGLRADNGTIIEDNDKILAEFGYPFALARVGFRTPRPTANTDLFYTIWETDQTIAGNLFEVSFSTLSNEQSPHFKFSDLRITLHLIAKN